MKACFRHPTGTPGDDLDGWGNLRVDPQDGGCVDPLAERMREAWPEHLIERLGPSQKERLSLWVIGRVNDHGMEALSVQGLKGMLNRLMKYYPEEVSAALMSSEPM